MPTRRLLSCFISVFTFALASSVFHGCRNDLDVNSDYKDVLVCYGVLNPYDSVQYVRVDKVYLGDGSALSAAQYNDSISFSPGRLSVLVQQWNAGQLRNTYVMLPDTSIDRDSGLFAHPFQVLYKGTFPVQKDGSSYKIIVTDLVKGTTIDATTEIPGDITMVNPPSTTSQLNLWDTTLMSLHFKSARYGLRYHTFLRFHYTEQFIYDTTQVSEKYTDWDFGDRDAQNNQGNQDVSIVFIRHKFFEHLASTIPVNPLVRRISGKVDLCFTGATEDLATYIDVGIAINNSINSVPFFTNINGGYGIFAARNTTFLVNYSLDQNTRYHMHLDPVLVPLSFVR